MNISRSIYYILSFLVMISCVDVHATFELINYALARLNPAQYPSPAGTEELLERTKTLLDFNRFSSLVEGLEKKSINDGEGGRGIQRKLKQRSESDFQEWQKWLGENKRPLPFIVRNDFANLARSDKQACVKSSDTYAAEASFPVKIVLGLLASGLSVYGIYRKYCKKKAEKKEAQTYKENINIGNTK